METAQNATIAVSNTAQDESSVRQLTPAELIRLQQQEEYIAFCAVGGLITEEGGELKPMKVIDFAQLLGVERTALYRWQKSIPDFWDKVHARRKELGGQARIMKVYNGLYLKAAAGDARAAAIWLANHDENFRMPAQKVEHEVGGGLADLMNQVRERQRQNAPKQVESEVIDGNRAADA